MNVKMRLIVTTILASILLPAWAIAPAAAAGGPRVGQANDAQIARLAGLGKLWGYIKITHPWMAFKTKEWDQALVAAIPKVKAAASAEEYGQAIDHMLSFLKDPATRRVTGNSQPGDVVSGIAPATNREQPYIEWPDPDTAVITATDYAAIDAAISRNPTRDMLRGLIYMASRAKSVILDIRRVRDEKNKGNLGGAVYWAMDNMIGTLVKENVPLPPTRILYHKGYAPQTRDWPFYFSGLVTTAGREVRMQPTPAPRPAHLIFILNAGSAIGLYGLMGGLQDQGLASVVQEGDKNPDAGVSFNYTANVMNLPEEIKVQIRSTEIVRANGAVGFSPDVEVPAPTDAQSDPAKQAALELSKKGPAPPTQGDGKAQQAAQRLSFKDDPYPQMSYPSEEYRLLALFRFWSAIEYFFPYKELMDQPWEKALSDFIPRMQQARDATEYALAVAELVTRIQDSHGNISSRDLDNYIGTHRPPLRVDPIEGQMVVTRIDDSAKGSVDLRVGDVVLAVDNEEITKRRERLAKYLPASTPGALHNKQAKYVLMGAKDSEIILKVRTQQGETKEVKLARSMRGANPVHEPQKLPVYTVLPDGVGYVDLDRLTDDQAEAAYAAVRNTPGLILDLRGYINGGAVRFASFMVKKAGLANYQYNEMQYEGMTGGFNKVTSLKTGFQHPGANPYQGKVAVLISHATQSASESVCLDLETIGLNVTFIGVPTSGADGTVTDTVLPGGISIMFTGSEIKHGDGRQLQRLGIQPNIEVRSTIEGIVQGRDEVLERAIKFLKGKPANGR